mmetsp:Transcript_76019/g.180896  ORF Transcript_76019/g.180896 Transcript_76019/m.180896 type:complete len:381 (-) Transcript_76019:202-1344(-)
MGSGSAPPTTGYGPGSRRRRKELAGDFMPQDFCPANYGVDENPQQDVLSSAEKFESAEAANAVSRLQEYIQGCSAFSPHTKVLTWNFEHQIEEDTSLRFRATVSFIFGSVPHHFCGDWQTSKKKAQRDTAERVRHYLAHREEAGRESVTTPAAIDPNTLPEHILQELQDLLREVDNNVMPHEGDVHASASTEWKMEERESPVDGSDGVVRATLIIYVDSDEHSVPHVMRGAWRPSRQAAQRDTLDRVLWYFGKSDEEFGTETRVSIGETPVTPAVLPTVSAGALAAEQAVVDTEEKTLLMSVQNALQKLFAKDTPPGERVWVWDYEEDAADAQLFRARVEVPAWGRQFHGDWCRGKKKAQRNACLAVKSCLDEYLPTAES